MLIEIKFRTNIPPKTDTFVTLTSDMFATKLKATSKVPYFRTDVAFTEDMITAERPAFSFFFDEAAFNAGIGPAESVSKELEEKTASDNVTFLMKMLFATSFPTKNNFENSYEALLLQARTMRSNGMADVLSEWIFPSNDKDFTYLRLGGVNTYTVLGVTWINDVVNHSRYNRLLKNILVFVKEKQDNIRRLTQDLTNTVTNRIKADNIKKLVTFLSETTTTANKDIEDWHKSAQKGLHGGGDVNESFSNGTTTEKLELLATKVAPILYQFLVIQSKNMVVVSSTTQNTTSLQISKEFTAFTAQDSNFRELLTIFKDFHIKYQLRQFYAGKNSTMREALMKSSDIPLTDIELAAIQSILATDDSFRKVMTTLLEFLPPRTLVASTDEKNPILLKIKSAATTSSCISSNLKLQEAILTYVLWGGETGSPLETFAILVNDVFLAPKGVRTADKALPDDALQHVDVQQIVTPQSEKPPTFEVEFQLELFEGTLNKDNVDAIRCSFEDKRLQLLFQRLKAKIDQGPFYQVRPFFTMMGDGKKSVAGGGSRKKKSMRRRRRRQQRQSVHRRIL